MSGSVSLTYTADDYADAALLHAWVVMLSWKGARALVFLWALYFGLILIINGDYSIGPIVITLVSTLVGALVIAGVLLALNRWILPKRARKLFAQQVSLHDPFLIEWDDAGIRLVSDRNRGEHRWGEFVRWAQDENGMVLYQSDALFNMLPARAFAQALPEIAGHLTSAGVRCARNGRAA